MDMILSILLAPMMLELLFTVAQIFAVIVPLLIAVAYLTLAERRVIGLMQLRKGPNVVGPAICRCAQTALERNHPAIRCIESGVRRRPDADLHPVAGGLGRDSLW